MPEVSRARQGELVRGVIEILAAEPEGLPAHEVLARLKSTVPPTDWESSYYPNNPSVRRRDKIVRFATIPFVKAGWLRKEKGVWRVTADGLAANERYTDPADLVRQAVRLYREWKKTQAPDPTDFDELDIAEVPDTSSILEEAEESAQTEIREYLLAMNPYEFQDLVAALLKAMGYHVAYVSPRGPDQGIDVIAYTDPLGGSRPRIKVQVKRQADKTTVEGIRSFLAVLGPQDIGLYVNTGGFTSEAEREARTQETRRLTLIDRKRLFELWVEHYRNVPEVERNLLPLRPVHFLDPRE
jgi:restriction system protein